jgi:chitinase
VTDIVEKYGFDGVDLDIETPSLLINPGDTDFRHPTTPSIVNLITAMRQMHDHFGPKFMIGEVPEAAQAQSGMQVYGGQFGSFLPVIYGTRDILSFVDAQDYNTPPLEGLDGNYYFPGNADYHVAMSEMLVHGFPIAGNPKDIFPPLPPEKVAIGLPAMPGSARNYTEIPAIEDALRYLIEGKSYSGATYKLRQPAAYPGFMGAMFWAINEDRRNNYKMSNAIGSFLHNLP